MSLLTVGSNAPDFDVAAHDGTRVRLRELAGSYVLLWFYPEADTPG
ncbi:MAG: redoxin domain-containing protein [Deltaproteobacteria bacterium]|nr:redoxin domain-containing protein [Deltaproteobacteria bacterium]